MVPVLGRARAGQYHHHAGRVDALHLGQHRAAIAVPQVQIEHQHVHGVHVEEKVRSGHGADFTDHLGRPGFFDHGPEKLPKRDRVLDEHDAGESCFFFGSHPLNIGQTEAPR